LASLERTVTLVDACTFGTDWLSWDEAGDRPEWREDGGGGNNAFHPSTRKVPELLAEQVEAADLLLVNKIDMADGGQVAVASGVARGLLKEEARGNVLEVSYGRVSVAELLGEDIMGAVAVKVGEKDMGHSHGHGDHDGGASSTCVEPGCADASHDHSSSSIAEEGKSSPCDDPACADPTHAHSHGHDHSPDGASTCDDPACTDPAHSHSHGHDHAAASADGTTTCDDPVCTDPTHSHSHEHSHATSTEVSMNHLGISSFVYRASVPFNSQRLLALLNQWPVPIKDELDIGLVVGLGNKEGNLDDETPEDKRAFVGVLRSKGFCWMAPTYWTNVRGGPGEDVWRHDTAMYWSHAGKHFGISTAGKWWASLGKDGMRPYFANNMGEYDRILREDWASEEWGDRRQELVFIGTRLDEDVIRSALNSCLCTEEEMVDYRARLRKYLDANPSTVR
jgi:G3E family GTPase